jgi:hypothetical protein
LGFGDALLASIAVLAGGVVVVAVSYIVPLVILKLIPRLRKMETRMPRSTLRRF